jgi:CBS domain-containing protein
VNVSEIMSKELRSTDPSSTVGEAATLMGEHAVGSVLVIDDGHLVGILTERDIVRALSSAHDAPVRPVTEWMTRRPVTITPDVDVKAALRTMVDGGFRHLPVCDGDQPVGMISIRDVAGSMAD